MQGQIFYWKILFKSKSIIVYILNFGSTFDISQGEISLLLKRHHMNVVSECFTLELHEKVYVLST